MRKSNLVSDYKIAKSAKGMNYSKTPFKIVERFKNPVKLLLERTYRMYFKTKNLEQICN